jgi:hypothetical protein
MRHRGIYSQILEAVPKLQFLNSNLRCKGKNQRVLEQAHLTQIKNAYILRKGDGYE